MVSALTTNKNPALMFLFVFMHGDMRCQRFQCDTYFCKLMIKSHRFYLIDSSHKIEQNCRLNL